MMHLADQRCEPCRGAVPPLADGEVRRLLAELDGWTAQEAHHLEKRWSTGDFARALDLVNRFGEVAEAEGHHPLLAFTWGWVEARVWTHRIDGLTRSDFVLAAKLDRVARRAEATPG